MRGSLSLDKYGIPMAFSANEEATVEDLADMPAIVLSSHEELPLSQDVKARGVWIGLGSSFEPRLPRATGARPPPPPPPVRSPLRAFVPLGATPPPAQDLSAPIPATMSIF